MPPGKNQCTTSVVPKAESRPCPERNHSSLLTTDCHSDRSAAEWRNPQLLFASYPKSLNFRLGDHSLERVDGVVAIAQVHQRVWSVPAEQRTVDSGENKCEKGLAQGCLHCGSRGNFRLLNRCAFRACSAEVFPRTRMGYACSVNCGNHNGHFDRRIYRLSCPDNRKAIDQNWDWVMLCCRRGGRHRLISLNLHHFEHSRFLTTQRPFVLGRNSDPPKLWGGSAAT